MGWVLGKGGPLSELKTEAEPAEVGLDPGRLQRIGQHFARYVDDGRLPGWLITVSRYGRLAYVSSYGSSDVEAGRDGYGVAAVLDDQADHLGGGDDAV